MQFSQKPNIFFESFLGFSKCRFNFKHFQEKDHPHS